MSLDRLPTLRKVKVCTVCNTAHEVLNRVTLQNLINEYDEFMSSLSEEKRQTFKQEYFAGKELAQRVTQCNQCGATLQEFKEGLCEHPTFMNWILVE